MGNNYYKSFAIAVTGTAQRIRASNLSPVTGQAVIQNLGTGTDAIYIGASDVSTSNGFKVAVGDHVSLGDIARSMGREDFDLSEMWIVGSTTIDARVLYLIWG